MSISRSRIVRRQSIPVHAEFLGGFTLITSLILEYRDDEGPLKLPHCFRASHAGAIGMLKEFASKWSHTMVPRHFY